MLIHDNLRASAAKTPDAVAVVDRSDSLTYAELDEASDRLASRLVELGVGVGDRVGLYLPKSIDAVIGVYAAMKSGGAYVPIDPSSKEARAGYIANNCGIQHLISVKAKRSMWESFAEAGVSHIITMDGGEDPGVTGLSVHQRSWVDEAAPANLPRLISQDLAYILYTSGSTGVPKGVMLSHENCLAFVEWAVREYEVTSQDRLSSHAPFHFDLSTFDLYAASLVGAPVYLVPKAVSLLPVEVKKFIESNEISVWYSVPSILTMLVEMGGLESGDLQSLRTLLFAGEVFPTKFLSRLMKRLPHVRFANLYGPTETNVCTAYTVPEPPPEDGPTISIGAAIDNVETFVVDSDDQILEPGQVGELLVRGPTVMAGYWGDSSLSAAKLTPSPIPRHHGGPVYRTGDLVEELPDSTYRFIGRRDNQIKSRGYRIELGDIEAALSSHPSVIEVVVVAVPDEMVSNRIVGFASVTDGLSDMELMRYCAEQVPKYMVPESIDIRDALPKTSTGKIDRRALSEELEPS
ncbi:MAG: amino acid adenylation domain-containing protein [Acidimicrobiia bacterium]|nr:amino acid adenylation domain-containing protein [Acidimicrobiia bacterium]